MSMDPEVLEYGDKHGNVNAIEGCDRCECGCKYWEKDKCHSCGAAWTEAAAQ